MTLHEWLRTVAFALNDDEPNRPFQRYLVKDLLAALNSALTLVARYRPDLYTETPVIKLQAGIQQDARGCCVNVLDVLEQTDEHGNHIKKLSGSRRTVNKVKNTWKKPSCLRTSNKFEYLVDSANIDVNLNGRFTVDPPVPCDVDVYVRVKCVTSPQPFTEVDVNMQVPGGAFCDQMVASWHYVLATMLTGDRFDNSVGAQDKQFHYKMFFDILGVVQRQEDRIESAEQA